MLLAQVGSERLDEITNPEKAIIRGADFYRAKGYTEGWINLVKTLTCGSKFALQICIASFSFFSSLTFSLFLDTIMNYDMPQKTFFTNHNKQFTFSHIVL